jgi:hypothetical protein
MHSSVRRLKPILESKPHEVHGLRRVPYIPSHFSHVGGDCTKVLSLVCGSRQILTTWRESPNDVVFNALNQMDCLKLGKKFHRLLNIYTMIRSSIFIFETHPFSCKAVLMFHFVLVEIINMRGAIYFDFSPFNQGASQKHDISLFPMKF